MNNLIKIFIILLLLNGSQSYAKEFLYILDDKCISDLYSFARKNITNDFVKIIRDSRGIILRYEFTDFINGYQHPDYSVLKEVEYFLAKIENPAIIEVHVGNLSDENFKNLKKWEVSTIMANNIEAMITLPTGMIEQDRINSIGYGEFLPAKNTSNNGGKNLNRVDIIILCNIGGE